MKQLNTCLSLCTEVYDLSKPNPPEDAYAFYRDYVIKANSPMLEPMFGMSDFYCHYLKRSSMSMTLMQSDHMLEVLHAKAKTKNLEPKV